MTAASPTDPVPQSPQRILALWFPYLRTERVLRRRLSNAWRSLPATGRPPLVVSHRDRGAQRIAAVDEAAAALGLKRGMGIADARAMHPRIEVMEAEPEADRRLLEALADWCDRYTPLVAMDGEDGLFLDITGCTHLFGGEKAMLSEVLTRFFHQGFDARAGLASTPGAAWAAARHGGAAIVDPGGEADRLTPLPLAALRLDADVQAGLASVGLRTVGAIIGAPRAPLARRFGAGLLMRLDQALGRVDEAISPRRPVAPLSAERHLAEPIGTMEDVELLVGLLAGTLKADLERRGEGARSLELGLFRVDGAVARVPISTARPLRDPALMRRLFHERLGVLAARLDAGFGYDLVRLSILAAERLEPRQTDLDSRTDMLEDDLAGLADRVAARLGGGALLAPVIQGSHVPERAAALVPWTPGPALAATPGLPEQERPIRLFRRPEPVSAAAEVPDGPPISFRWRRALYRVARAEGPERIAPEWWHEPSDTAERDYFRVEDETGRRYWLFREGHYGDPGLPPRWFVQGMFA
ncbi:MAG: DNA polymerase Y family protein [Rhizobiaceae bacterium]|nr:DNA polymerase Y family protein [Rhizobiaceae bacterium]